MIPKEPYYNTDINVLGGVPDYPAMISFVTGTLSGERESAFTFRTGNATKRFIAAIERSIICCKNQGHRELFQSALNSLELTVEQKYSIIFWQLIINNNLFSDITKNYYLRMLYAGRVALSSDEILSYLYELRREKEGELQWSESTLKINASKYLTLLKKIGLVEGDKTKNIKYQNIGDDLFLYLVRLSQVIYPEDQTSQNPLLQFSLMDETSLIKKLKSIKFTPYWAITQLGTDIKIELINHE